MSINIANIQNYQQRLIMLSALPSEQEVEAFIQILSHLQMLIDLHGDGDYVLSREELEALIECLINNKIEDGIYNNIFGTVCAELFNTEMVSLLILLQNQGFLTRERFHRIVSLDDPSDLIYTFDGFGVENCTDEDIDDIISNEYPANLYCVIDHLKQSSLNTVENRACIRQNPELINLIFHWNDHDFGLNQSILDKLFNCQSPENLTRVFKFFSNNGFHEKFLANVLLNFMHIFENTAVRKGVCTLPPHLCITAMKRIKKICLERSSDEDAVLKICNYIKKIKRKLIRISDLKNYYTICSNLKDSTYDSSDRDKLERITSYLHAFIEQNASDHNELSKEEKIGLLRCLLENSVNEFQYWDLIEEILKLTFSGNTAKALSQLAAQWCLTLARFNSIIANPMIAQVLANFIQSNFRSQNNNSWYSHTNVLTYIDDIIESDNPYVFSRVIRLLNHTFLLNEANVISLKYHPHAADICYILLEISEENSRLVTQALLNLLLNITAPHNLLHVVAALHESGMRAFYPVVFHYASVFSSDDVTDAIANLPPHAMTERLFSNILRTCREAGQNYPAAINNILALIDPLIEEVEEGEDEENIAFAQTTHTASVHRTVSESATRLMEEYKGAIQGPLLKGVLNEVKKWSNTLPDSDLKCAAAKRAIKKLTTPRYTFIDPASNVNIKELLAIVWLALHGNTPETKWSADTQQLLIDGLYELKREYNFDPITGEDKGGRDKPACLPGQFNKLMEKLGGIHPKVILHYVTRNTASSRLKDVVNKRAEFYLASFIKNATTIEELNKALDLIQTVKLEGTEHIWDAIKNDVAEDVFSTHGSLYKDKDDPNFTGLVAEGIWTQLKLPSFQKEISESKGYRKYCTNVLLAPGFFRQNEKTEKRIVKRPAEMSTERLQEEAMPIKYAK